MRIALGSIITVPFAVMVVVCDIRITDGKAVLEGLAAQIDIDELYQDLSQIKILMTNHPLHYLYPEQILSRLFFFRRLLHHTDCQSCRTHG